MFNLRHIANNIILDHSIKPIIDQPFEFVGELLTKFAGSRLKFAIRIMEISFHLCLNKYHSPFPFVDYTYQLPIINDVLMSRNLGTITIEELAHLLHPSYTINVNNPSAFIQYVIATLYPDLFTFPASFEHALHRQPEPTKIDKLDFVLSQFIDEPAVVSSMFAYYEQLIQALDVKTFTIHKLAPITINDFEVNLRIPFYFTTSKGKQHIADLRFEHSDMLTSDISYISTVNARLHLLTRSSTLSNPDEIKLISLFPLQNLIIKFYHDPMITQLEL